MKPAEPRFAGRLEPLGRDFGVRADQPLLLSLEQAGLPWPSSCRNGTCRSCIGRLAEGRVRYEIPWPGLSAEEKTEGCVLTCVAYPLTDLVLQGPGC